MPLKARGGQDATAVRLLERVAALERSRWPDAMPEYRHALHRLGVRCLDHPSAVAELHRWLVRVDRSVWRWPDARESWRDAQVDVAVEAGSLLLKFAGLLHASKRPNLRSMLRYVVRTRTLDRLRGERRHHRQRESAARIETLRDARANPERAVFAREVHALLDDGRATSAALLRVGLGDSVTRAARRCGVCRQAVYGRRAALRRAVEVEVDRAELEDRYGRENAKTAAGRASSK